jgi:NAD(P)-dependent dehydrogenase (short-subunit alcohol dehydrogenase family)
MAAQPRKRKHNSPTLHGRIALVTGSSRGAGRAIAAVLGEHGATVYVTGRSVRGQPTTDNLPGTIEESAEEVTSRGGQGFGTGRSGSRDCAARRVHSRTALWRVLRAEPDALWRTLRAARYLG